MIENIKAIILSSKCKTLGNWINKPQLLILTHFYFPPIILICLHGKSPILKYHFSFSVGPFLIGNDFVMTGYSRAMKHQISSKTAWY